MENFLSLLSGIILTLQPSILIYCFIGVFLGTFIGVLPGIGALAAISLLLPVIFHLPPTESIVMLAAVYYGAQYGGSIASILLNIPGTPSAAIVCLDGHPMTKQGRAGIALFITTVASFVGSLVGIFLLTIFIVDIGNIGLKFGPAEYFSLMLLALVISSGVITGSWLKGMAMVVLGLLIGTIGTDINSGVARFHFDIPELIDGISLVVLSIGLFGLVEIISSCTANYSTKYNKITFRSMLPTIDDIKRSCAPIFRGSIIGSFFGALPGTGPTIAAFSSYAIEKKLSDDPKRFGNGAIEGISGPESANNSASQTAFAPTLALGIPGDAVMALIIGALIIQGIQPGPMMIVQQPDLFWGLIGSFVVGNILLLILNIPLIAIWIRFLQIPYHFLYPSIIIFISISVYSVNNNVFDLYLAVVVGIIGYLLYTAQFQFAPLLLGFVLGPLMEENLKRALQISHGNLITFVERPISALLISIVLFIIIFSVLRTYKTKRLTRMY